MDGWWGADDPAVSDGCRQAELGARYLAMGVTKAALEVFERLQLWEEAIRCYHLLQQRQRVSRAP